MSARKRQTLQYVSILAHLSALVKNCRILNVFALSAPVSVHFMLVRQFAGNFSLNLCVSPKMRFFGRLLVKNQKKGLYFSFKRGMLYPTEVCCWIHDSPERFSLTHPVPLFFKLLFSSFTFLSFTLSCTGQKKRFPNLHGEALFRCYFQVLADTTSPSPSVTPLLVGEALAVLATSSVSPEALLPGELSSASETERLYHILRFRFAPHFLEGFPSYNLSVNASHCHLSL